VLKPMEEGGNFRVFVVLVTWPELSNEKGQPKISIDAILRIFSGNGARSAVAHMLKLTPTGEAARELEKVFRVVEYAVGLLDEFPPYTLVLKLRPDLCFYAPLPASLFDRSWGRLVVVPSQLDLRDVKGSRERKKLGGFRTVLAKSRVQDHVALGRLDVMRAYASFGTWLQMNRVTAADKPVEILLGEHLHRLGVGVEVSCRISYGLMRL